MGGVRRAGDAGGATNGTNQIGELCAVLQALRTHPGPEPLTIETDSQYAINCSTTWVKGWKRNGWRNSQKKPVKNVELIKAIDEEIARRPGPVRFVWVKGHAGNAGNELVDELARTYAGDCRSGARDGYLPVEGWQSLIHSEYARGLDVPPDVQLVLDGRAPADALRKPASDASTGGAAGRASDARADGGARVRRRDGSTARRSVADLLAEPEGVPDIASAPRPTRDGVHAPGSDAPGSAHGIVRDTVRIDYAADDLTDGATDVSSATDVASDVSSDIASASATDAAAAQTDTTDTTGVANTASTSSTLDDASVLAAPTPASQTSSAASAVQQSPAQTTPAAPAAQTAPAPASPSGLTASGTIRITPPPSGSPRWAGKDLYITGSIVIDAPIAPDGTIDLAGAEFRLTSVRER